MRRRGNRLGRRSFATVVRRNRILPAPGFLPVENGMELRLTPTAVPLDHIPQQLINRPARPHSGAIPAKTNAGVTVWLRAAHGPSIN